MEFNLKRMLFVLKRTCMLYFKDMLHSCITLFAFGILAPKLFGSEMLIAMYGFIMAQLQISVA